MIYLRRISILPLKPFRHSGQGDKHHKGVHEGKEPLACHAPGHAHHVLLGHADREEALGVSGAKLVGFARAGQIRGQDDHPRLVGGTACKVGSSSIFNMTTNLSWAGGVSPGWASDVMRDDRNSIKNTSVRPCEWK
jgi:hypothetical protein